MLWLTDKLDKIQIYLGHTWHNRMHGFSEGLSPCIHEFTSHDMCESMNRLSPGAGPEPYLLSIRPLALCTLKMQEKLLKVCTLQNSAHQLSSTSKSTGSFNRTCEIRVLSAKKWPTSSDWEISQRTHCSLAISRECSPGCCSSWEGGKMKMQNREFKESVKGRRWIFMLISLRTYCIAFGPTWYQ